VQGEVRDSLSGVPIGSGFVILEDLAGVEVTRELVSYAGQFTVRAPGPGRFRLRWARIGYRAVVSPELELSGGAAVPYVFHVLPIAVQLPAVEVRGERQCDVRPGAAAATAALWGEVQKALETTAWTDRRGNFRYTWYSFEREWDRNRRRLQDEQGRTQRALTSRPFATVAPEQLARGGYVVEKAPDVWYYLPDAHTLLDANFLDTHCFSVAPPDPDRPGEVGLAFEPAPGRTLPDVAGALWIDEGTLQLRALEVAYVNLPWDIEDDRVGGTVQFLMLPSGAWVVRDWEIRAPLLESRDVVGLEGSYRREVLVRGFHDTGGRVVEVLGARGALVYSAERAWVEGVVFDSTRNAPLTGAEVRIAGTDVADRTGAGGHFELSAPLEGSYRVVVESPWLDSIGFRDSGRVVALAAGAIRALHIGVPHADSIAARLCAEAPEGPDTRTVIGRVRGGDGAPVPGARVSGSWQTLGWSADANISVHSIRVEVSAGDDGSYVLCGIPQAQPVTVAAEGDSAGTGVARVILPTTVGGAVLLSRDALPDAPYETRPTAAARTVRLDLAVAPNAAAAPALPAFGGVVLDRIASRLLDSALVVVNGRDTMATRADGTFGRQVAWQPGPNPITVTRAGYQPLAVDLWVDSGNVEVAVRLTLAPAAVQLAGVEVSGTAVDQGLARVGFDRRRDIGLGTFLEYEDLVSRRHAVQTWVDLLRGVPGVTMLPNPAGYGGVVPSLTGMRSMRGQVSGAGAGCIVPRIYVDGRLAYDPDPTRDLGDVYDLVSGAAQPGDVVAIEVYRRASEVPAEYGGAQAGCGAILVWTAVGTTSRMP
jgi:hypothetical protein